MIHQLCENLENGEGLEGQHSSTSEEIETIEPGFSFTSVVQK